MAPDAVFDQIFNLGVEIDELGRRRPVIRSHAPRDNGTCNAFNLIFISFKILTIVSMMKRTWFCDANKITKSVRIQMSRGECSASDYSIVRLCIIQSKEK
jgi:hypothetical protein